ncbi:2-C-methyl-D-erythritol 4-phosphate cytidylyltransferase [Vulcanibacillus modesticaldus]|uniref:2-C-methyl-D-erythritol 4-phosphate cytidylyltransferase n=1 Tax=Vulcanibacillus modesticaldus TaxID=337097 RepID=A0A1D2YRZ7_9BACI|nr:2-C-methyl-D-erythritol 4-phosphate cytidylyltransferase [Vulcanibacillus modesticaldus]OEF96393.1 2-C-methyl-D-erythritol 4-phosphate cytidylyltransferase [Vulcanibacillus modesticaldus]
MSCGILIAAAGQGKRMGAGINKQFLNINGKPILVHTLEKFQNKDWINEIIIVAHPKELNEVRRLIQKFGLSVDKIVPGGNERQESIQNGLSYIRSDWVMVHDGARPFIDPKLLDKLYIQLQTKEAVVLGVPTKDTIKIVDETLYIKHTPDRKSLWAIQTPQAFRLSILKEAYQKAKEDGFLGTDDSSLVERIGMKVHILEGDYRNIKITTPEDLIWAKSILDEWSEFK